MGTNRNYSPSAAIGAVLTATPNTEAAILARIIRADDDPLAQDVARCLLSMRLPSGDEERVNELSAKAQAGSLTNAETQELDSYLQVLTGRPASQGTRPAQSGTGLSRAVKRELARQVRERAAEHNSYAARRRMRRSSGPVVSRATWRS